jgi:hypothetical protein
MPDRAVIKSGPCQDLQYRVDDSPGRDTDSASLGQHPYMSNLRRLLIPRRLRARDNYKQNNVIHRASRTPSTEAHRRPGVDRDVRCEDLPSINAVA